MIKIFGIPNCGSVKKALAWCDAQQVEYTFVNFKKNEVSAEQVQKWLACVGPVLLNKKGTTWRKVPQEVQQKVQADPQALVALLVEMPTLMKRPIIETQQGQVLVGVEEEQWQQHLL